MSQDSLLVLSCARTRNRFCEMSGEQWSRVSRVEQSGGRQDARCMITNTLGHRVGALYVTIDYLLHLGSNARCRGQSMRSAVFP